MCNFYYKICDSRISEEKAVSVAKFGVFKAQVVVMCNQTKY